MTISETVTDVDPRYFRNVLGHFPTGVVVITSLDPDGNPVGMAVGSFTSVSLDPPLVAFLPDKSSSTFPKVRDAGRFCVNILSAKQQNVCRSMSLKRPDKFADISWTAAPSGMPCIDSSIAWIDCDIDTVHDAGDHYIVVGRVTSMEIDRADTPLIFFQGGYGRFASTSLTAPGEADLYRPLTLVDTARSEMASVADDLNVECCASAAIGDQLVLLGSSMSASLRTAPHTRLGQRMPLVPPLALPLMAWADPRTLERWIASGGDSLDRELLAGTIARVRDRGWSLVLRSDAQVRFERAVSRLRLVGATREEADEVTEAARSLGLDGYEPASVDPGTPYDVRVVSAPVFDENGLPVLLLSLYQLPRQLSGSDVLRYRDRLVTAAAAVTEMIGGTSPVG